MDGDTGSGEPDLMTLARRNEHFRQVVATGEHQQVVVMTLRAGEEIGEETHHDTDQMLLFVDGEGTAVLEGRPAPVRAGHMTFVPAGTLHNFVNTGEGPLRLITTYAPPEHPPGTVHATKAEADEDHHH